MALEFGVIDINSMLASMTARDLDGWARHFRKHGFWRDSQEHLLAQHCALFYNANRGKKQRPLKGSDFLLHKPEEKPESVESMVEKLKRAFSMWR